LVARLKKTKRHILSDYCTKTSKRWGDFFIALHKIKRTKYNVFWEKPLIVRK
jgi:hypothetical protein